jgi:hypothetical protein
MMNMRYHVTFMICIGMILALTSNGFAETEVNEPDRFLGGHTFVVTGSVPDPFVSTRVGSITSIGLGNLNIAADIPLSGGVVLKKGDYMLGILGIGTELQLGLAEWIALRAAVVGIVFSGINLNAVFSYGASIGYAYSGGIMVRMLRTDAFQCSLSVDLEQNSFFGIKPAQFVADSLASGELSTDRLLNQADATGIAAGVHAAYTVCRSIGMWGSISFKHSMTADPDTDQLVPGIGISVDLNPLFTIPVGLDTNYRVEITIADTGYPTHHMVLGLFVTGRTNFICGIEGDVYLRNIDDILIISGIQCAFRMRYFW